MFSSSLPSRIKTHEQRLNPQYESHQRTLVAPPLRFQISMWILCFSIFMASCSSTPLLPDLNFTSPAIFTDRDGMKTTVPFDAKIEPPGVAPEDQRNEWCYGCVHSDVALDIPTPDSVPIPGAKKTKMNRNRSQKSRRKTSRPVLKMTDHERKKREEMDRSADQLITYLSSEQSNVEHINRMKHLRELQKQEIIIEV